LAGSAVTVAVTLGMAVLMAAIGRGGGSFYAPVLLAYGSAVLRAATTARCVLAPREGGFPEMARRRHRVGKQTSDLQERPLRLRFHPDSILGQKASPVTLFDGALQDFFHVMLDFMREHRGIGLAAPQVGVLQRVVVANTREGPVCLANPEIVDQAGPDTMVESCLSLPGTAVIVERNTQIHIRGRDHRGKKVEFEAVGLLARVLQHEVDHLDGVLISDYDVPVAPTRPERRTGSLA